MNIDRNCLEFTLISLQLSRNDCGVSSNNDGLDTGSTRAGVERRFAFMFVFRPRMFKLKSEANPPSTSMIGFRKAKIDDTRHLLVKSWTHKLDRFTEDKRFGNVIMKSLALRSLCGTNR